MEKPNITDPRDTRIRQMWFDGFDDGEKRPLGLHWAKNPWPDRDGELRALWNAGLSDHDIAVAMGITKGSVAGRRARLGIVTRDQEAATPATVEARAPTNPNAPWPARDEELRAHWASSLSASEIGRRMKLSKNAVMSRAHRMGLPARPSPIVRDGVVRENLPVRQVRAREFDKIVPVAKDAAETAPAAVKRFLKSEPCCWPLGEPGSKSFRFCDEASVPGRAYCPTHHRLSVAGKMMPEKTAEKIAQYA